MVLVCWYLQEGPQSILRSLAENKVKILKIKGEFEENCHNNNIPIIVCSIAYKFLRGSFNYDYNYPLFLSLEKIV